MQVTETLSEGLKRGFTVVLPASDLENKRAAKLAEMGKTLRLPGFRPGKVPLSVVKQRFGREVSVDVLQESVTAATRQVLSDRGLRTASEPKIDLANPEVIAQPAAADIEFKMEVELLPEIPMPDFASIRLTRLKAEPGEPAIERTLADIAKRRRELVDITEDRGAEVGDVVTVDFVGRVDGTELPNGTGTGIDVDVGGDGFIPGFAEQLVGMRAGETRTIEVAFPADYAEVAVAGKPASFTVTAQKLRRPVLPVVDDDLAKQIGFEGLEDLRASIARRFQAEYDRLARLRLKRQLLDALAAQASFDIPRSLADAEFVQIWAQVEEDRKGDRLDPEDRDKDEETLKADYRAIADRRVRLGLLLSEIGRANAITVGADEMNRAMRAEAGRYPGREQQVMEFFRRTPHAAERLRGPLFEDKVIDFLVELAQVTDQSVSPEELETEPAAG
jgi:trigger factor